MQLSNLTDGKIFFVFSASVVSSLNCHFDLWEKSAEIIRFLTIVPQVSANGIASREMTATEFL